MGMMTCCAMRDKDYPDPNAKNGKVSAKDKLGAGSIERHLAEAEEELGYTGL